MKEDNKTNLKIAKYLFQISLKNGRLDENYLLILSRELKNNFKSRSFDILKKLIFLVDNYLQNQTLRIETSANLNEKQILTIKKYFEAKLNRSLNVKIVENPNLLGGLKITIHDKEWDFSLQGKIQQMKEVLSV